MWLHQITHNCTGKHDSNDGEWIGEVDNGRISSLEAESASRQPSWTKIKEGVGSLGQGKNIGKNIFKSFRLG